MDLIIDENLVDESKYDIKCPNYMQPIGITVHNTGNSASADDEIAYMNRNDMEVSYHFAVDENHAVQGLPLDRNGWHASDGNGTGNMQTIGIEIARSTSEDESLFDEAEINGAKLCAYLCKKYDWSIDDIKTHQYYAPDNKYCPHKTLDRGWDRFLEMVQSYMDEDTQDCDSDDCDNEDNQEDNQDCDNNDECIYPDGWNEIDGIWYYYEDGKLVKHDFRRDSKGDWYFLSDDGAMLTNSWISWKNRDCYVGADGKCYTNGWYKIDGSWYIFDSNGYTLYSQWYHNDSGTWSYLNADGQAVIGWHKLKWEDSEDYYYFDGEGVMQVNSWVNEYFVCNTGKMLTSTWIGHDNKWYWVGIDGAWLDYPTWQSDTRPTDGYDIYEY